MIHHKLTRHAKLLAVVSLLMATSAGVFVYTSLPSKSSSNPIANNSQTAPRNNVADSSPKQNNPQCTMSSCDMAQMDHSAMDLGPADNFYDLRFIDAMILHHEGALIMAKDVLQKSPRPELRQLANNVINTQTVEIDQMKQWRKTWYPDVPETPMAWHKPMNHMMAMSPAHVQAMRMEVDLGKSDDNYDLRFINAMVVHHEGAVTMAQDVLQKSQRPEMLQLAKDVIKAQKAEIQQMQQWRKSWYTTGSSVDNSV